MTKFSDNPTWPTRALQTWLILIGKAHNRQTLTYGQLAKLLQYDGAGTMAQMLGHIHAYCLNNDLHLLNYLVVNRETGLPSDYMGKLGDLNAAREKIFNYNWYNLIPPTPEAFKREYDRWRNREFNHESN